MQKLVWLLLLTIAPVLMGQQSGNAPKPEDGFVAGKLYANAYFGFVLKLPDAPSYRDYDAPPKNIQFDHFIYGVIPHSKFATVFDVIANRAVQGSSEEAQAAARWSDAEPPKKKLIANHEFWRSESKIKIPKLPDKPRMPEMFGVKYVTVMNGYLLQFRMMGVDYKLVTEFENAVESLRFVDPAKARSELGPDARVYELAARCARAASGSTSP